MNINAIKHGMKIILSDMEVIANKVSFAKIQKSATARSIIGKVTIELDHAISEETNDKCIDVLQRYLGTMGIDCPIMKFKFVQKEVEEIVENQTSEVADGLGGVYNIVNQLANTPGTNDKRDILKQHANNEVFKNVLKYTYSDNLNYGFSESKIRELLKEADSTNRIIRGWITKWDNPFDMLEELAHSNINDTLRSYVANFLLMQSEEERELLIRVLTKDLRCNISSKTINKAIPKLITTWEIQQAYKLEKVKLKQGEWIALSLKLNGIRTTFFRDEFKSRQNKVMTGYEHIKADIAKLEEFTGYVFDGELIRNNIDNLSDNENFRLTTSIVNSDAAEKPEIQMVIFDMLPISEFIQGESTRTFKDRMLQMRRVKELILKLGLTNIDVAPIYYHGTDHTQISKLLSEVDKAGLEGLMLLKNVTYKCKRHSGIAKCKMFKEADLKIVGYNEGTGSNKGSLGSFVVEYKGNTVGVGSGYTEEERVKFWRDRDTMIGRYISVQYKDETRDKHTGQHSLQFPIYLKVKAVDEEVNGDI